MIARKTKPHETTKTKRHIVKHLNSSFLVLISNEKIYDGKEERPITRTAKGRVIIPSYIMMGKAKVGAVRISPMLIT